MCTSMHAQRYRFFTRLAVRTELLWKIPPDRALRLIGFLKIQLIRKDFNTKESRDILLKSHIPFLLQTSLSISYLLYNSMSQKLFREASKHRNNKPEEKRKLTMEKFKRELVDDKLYNIIFSDGE